MKQEVPRALPAALPCSPAAAASPIENKQRGVGEGAAQLPPLRARVSSPTDLRLHPRRDERTSATESELPSRSRNHQPQQQQQLRPRASQQPLRSLGEGAGQQAPLWPVSTPWCPASSATPAPLTGRNSAKPKKIPPKKDGYTSKKLVVKWKPTMERDPGGVPAVRRRKKQLGTGKEQKKAGRPPKHPTAKLKNSVHTTKSRRNRKCGDCEACQLKTDCGRCDFCRDKPKFGGGNLKRQKCRWRQCLHFAMKRLLPEEWSSPEAEGAAAAGWKVRRRRNAFGGRSRKPARIKQVGRRGAKGRGQKRRAKASFQPEAEELPSVSKPIDLSKVPNRDISDQQPLKLKEEAKEAKELSQNYVKDLRIVPQPAKEKLQIPQPVKEEPEVPCQPTPPTQVPVKESDTRLPAVNLLLATSPRIKQDRTEPGGDHRPLSDSPVLAGLPQSKGPRETQGSEVVVLDDEEDDEVEQLQPIRPPVIMEIYSLGGVQPLGQLDSVLREFLAELNEIPLPAHWEVLPLLGGPDLRLVQRSKHSTMSAAVIHIRPGLFFHVVMRNLLVPPEHELYAKHPARLTTVDEVVDLICDLEAYRLCLGWPAGWHAGERSQACDVLVHSGCCPQCRLNPWPSGSGTR